MRNQVMPIMSASGEMEIIQSPMYGIVADIVKNNKNLTPDLQNAIAKFIDFESTPRYSINTDFKLDDGTPEA